MQNWKALIFGRVKAKFKNICQNDFKKAYPQVVIIIDSTEFEIQRPSTPSCQQLTFSYYKNCNTLKVLAGITPSGAIIFISELWGGSISDKELFIKSGILDM